MKNSLKRGVSLVSVLAILVILSVIAGTVTVAVNYVIQDTYKREFINEYQLVKSATKDYIMRNSGKIDFTQTTIDVSTMDAVSLEQFEGEKIVNNKIMVYIIDLEKIGVYNTTYGINEDENDVYVVSEDTYEVYYKKGFSKSGEVQYKGIYN